MAQLGDAFSAEQRRESVARQLRPGTVIYLDVVFSQGRRSKYLVIAELAADLSRIKGRLHEEVLTEVIAAVKRAPTLSPAEQTRIADSLARQAAGGN